MATGNRQAVGWKEPGDLPSLRDPEPKGCKSRVICGSCLRHLWQLRLVYMITPHQAPCRKLMDYNTSGYWVNLML